MSTLRRLVVVWSEPFADPRFAVPVSLLAVATAALVAIAVRLWGSQ